MNDVANSGPRFGLAPVSRLEGDPGSGGSIGSVRHRSLNAGPARQLREGLDPWSMSTSLTVGLEGGGVGRDQRSVACAADSEADDVAGAMLETCGSGSGAGRAGGRTFPVIE
jgi:hypothetical protein